jgi:hypothetical protein
MKKENFLNRNPLSDIYIKSKIILKTDLLL